MATNKITVNGQQYDSVEAMPPDVRRIYEDALKAIDPALGGAKGAATTQFISGIGGGFGLKSNIVVNRVITVNNQTYKSVEEMPPEVRQMFENGLQQARGTMAVTSKSTVHSDMNLGRPEMRSVYNPGGPSDQLRPIEPSMAPEAKRFLLSLVFWVVVGLLVFTFLGSLTLHINLK